MTVAQVRGKLKQVIDPELGIDIVELGLIYKIKVVGSKIKILMTLTTPGCPLAPTIERMIRDALANLPGVNPERDVSITITFDPPWVIDMVSEFARAELGF